MFILAQIIGALGAFAAIIASQMKNKKIYLIYYAISYALFIVNMVLLKAYAGAINCFILMILTIITNKYEKTSIPKKIIVLFSVVILIGNIITYKNVYSLLPFIASYIYLIILVSKNMNTIRQSTLTMRLLWSIYDFIVKAYSTFILDIFSVISNIIAIYRYDIKKE